MPKNARPLLSTALPPPLPPPFSPRAACSAVPNLGLVCITVGPEVRYRTMTRTRFLALDADAQQAALDDLYRHNVRTLFAAVDYCHANGLRLYRMTSNLFPHIDTPFGRAMAEVLAPAVAGFGALADRLGVRVVVHPEQWVVLNSESPAVVGASVDTLAHHGWIFDLLGLPRSPWAMILVHGGKGGRPNELAETIANRLPENVRTRLALENDECAYSAGQILDVCRKAGVPMVFDAHHHAVRERLRTYSHPGVAEMTRLARTTWPEPDWQIVHISNGREAFADPCHSDRIRTFPKAFFDVQWVEVEAKHKEDAIVPLRRRLLRARSA